MRTPGTTLNDTRFPYSTLFRSTDGSPSPAAQEMGSEPPPAVRKAPLPALTKAGGPDSPQPQVAHGTRSLARLLETPRHDAGSPARRAACRGRGRIQRQRLPQAAVGQAQGAVRRPRLPPAHRRPLRRSEEHTSELQSIMRIP